LVCGKSWSPCATKRAVGPDTRHEEADRAAEAAGEVLGPDRSRAYLPVPELRITRSRTAGQIANRGFGTPQALMDLHDLEHNVRDGLHIASLAGAALAVIAGFGGLRDDGDELSFAPRLPAAITRVAFRVAFGGNTLRVEVTPGSASYSSRRDGEPLRFRHWGEPAHLAPGATIVRPTPPHEPLLAPKQPPHRAPTPRSQRPVRLPGR
jgi:hypothetical protein